MARKNAKFKENSDTSLTDAANNGDEGVVQQSLEKEESPAPVKKATLSPCLRRILLWSIVVTVFCFIDGLFCMLIFRNDLLKRCVSKNNDSMTCLMLTFGANPETTAKNGDTPLIEAAGKGHEAVVHLLLEKGANIEAKNYDGRTAFDEARTDSIKRLLRPRPQRLRARSS